MLVPIVKGVKIQVEFKPATVSEHRLIGYESRLLAREDLSNGRVDAGYVRLGQSVTALYETVPIGGPRSNVDLRDAESPPKIEPSVRLSRRVRPIGEGGEIRAGVRGAVTT